MSVVSSIYALLGAIAQIAIITITAFLAAGAISGALKPRKATVRKNGAIRGG